MTRRKFSAVQFVAHLVLLFFSLMCLIPFLLLISASLTGKQELLVTGISLIPKNPELTAYKAVFRVPMQIVRAYGVTIFITVVGTVLNMVICFLAAFALSNRNFVYRRVVSFYLYFTMIFSGGMIPYYITVSKYLKLTDNIWVMILPLLASPMTIFLLRTYLYDIPYTLHEAAKIDGASEYQVLFRVVLPMSKTPLAIIGFQVALGYWNAWQEALLFITDSDLYPLQMLLQRMTNYVSMMKNVRFAGKALASSLPDGAIIAATCVVAIGPMLFAFLLFQKQFVAGITNGAVKE